MAEVGREAGAGRAGVGDGEAWQGREVSERGARGSGSPAVGLGGEKRALRLAWEGWVQRSSSEGGSLMKRGGRRRFLVGRRGCPRAQRKGRGRGRGKAGEGGAVQGAAGAGLEWLGKVQVWVWAAEDGAGEGAEVSLALFRHCAGISRFVKRKRGRRRQGRTGRG